MSTEDYDPATSLPKNLKEYAVWAQRRRNEGYPDFDRARKAFWPEGIADLSDAIPELNPIIIHCQRERRSDEGLGDRDTHTWLIRWLAAHLRITTTQAANLAWAEVAEALPGAGPRPTSSRVPNSGIVVDTTPICDRPMGESIASAASFIANVFHVLDAQANRPVELVASDLVRRLHGGFGQSSDAAHWAIHFAVKLGKLKATVRCHASIDDVSGTSGLARTSNSNAPRVAMEIPKGVPTPFDRFCVSATAGLFEWDPTACIDEFDPGSSERYDPRKTEPSTFAEMRLHMAHWVGFARVPTGQPPIIAKGANIEFLGLYCIDQFGSWDLPALGKLRARYAMQTGKTGDEIEATTLKEIADFLRRLSRSPAAFSEVIEAEVSAHGVQKADSHSDTVSKSCTKPKKSTTKGEARVKLIAALTQHHKYSDGGCLNLDPVGNNKLAALAGTSVSSASAFFSDMFEGYAKYRAICRDPGLLVDSLKALNNEFAPRNLYGRQPERDNHREADEGK